MVFLWIIAHDVRNNLLEIQKVITTLKFAVSGTLGTGQRFTPKKTEGSCNLL